MITHIEQHDQDSLGLLAISQNVTLNGMGQQESQGALCFFADVVNGCCSILPTQNSGACGERCVSIASSCFMALTGHALSWLPAMISWMPCRKGSILEVGRVSSICLSFSINLMLLSVKNQLWNAGPIWRSIGLYINSPILRKPANASEKAARITMSV